MEFSYNYWSCPAYLSYKSVVQSMDYEDINQRNLEMFGPNVAVKYALALNKILNLGCDSTYFLITNPSSLVQRMHAGLVTGKSRVRTWTEATNVKLLLKTISYSGDIHLCK